MKTNSIFCQWGATALMMTATCMFWTACSDDDDDAVKLAAPEVALSEATATSLTFTWAPVENASQYDYTLSKDEVMLLQGTTSYTQLTFKGLDEGATYTLNVFACPANDGGYTNSLPGSASGTTGTLPDFAQPQLSVSYTSRTAIYVSWDKIPEAESYSWTALDAAGTVVATAAADTNTYAGIFELEQGATYTIQVSANATSAYHASEVSTITATTLLITDAPDLSSEWQLLASGVKFVEYYSALPEFTCDLYQKTDGSEYCFHNFTTGYDLYFTATYALTGDDSYLGYYLVPSQGGSWDGFYYLFGQDWYTSFPLYFKNWPGHYVDYSAISTYTTYTTISFDYKSGWICAYLNPCSDDGSYEDAIWAYLYFSWE
jgi:hypothetical protein